MLTVDDRVSVLRGCEGDESKAAKRLRYVGVGEVTVLGEVVVEFVFRCSLGKPTHEQLHRRFSFQFHLELSTAQVVILV